MFHPAEGMSHGDRKDGFVIVGVGAAGGILAAEAPAVPQKSVWSQKRLAGEDHE
jgi:hypothetical protein